MRTKLQDIRLATLRNKYDVIVATETWLDDSIHDNELFNNNYVIFRRDRYTTSLSGKPGPGGGVLIAVSKTLQAKRIDHFESDLEDLWVSVTLSGDNVLRAVLICAVYLPPPVTLNTLNKSFNSISAVLDSNACQSVILGDFNLGFVQWAKDPMGQLIPSNCSSSLGLSLVDFMSMNDLSQYNHVNNVNNRILDLVLSNFNGLSVAHNYDILSKLDVHHPALDIELHLNCPMVLKSKQFATHNFKKADYMQVNSMLSGVDWLSELSLVEDVNFMVNKFYNILRTIIEATVPKSKRQNRNYPHWFSRNLIKIIAEKEKIRARYKKYRNPRDLLEIKLLTGRIEKYIKQSYGHHINRVECSIRDNPKKFWSFVKETRGGSSTIPNEMMNEANDVACTGEDICNLFASKFASVFNNNKPRTSVTPPRSSHPQNFPQDALGTIHVSEQKIFKAITKINPSKGAGPDGIPPYFIKKTSKHLTLPLKIIFAHSLNTGEFPTLWKHSNIVPIYKKGERNKVANYRPVSILSQFSKIFEQAVCQDLTNYSNKIVNERQYGFCKNKSTTGNLLHYIADLSKAVDGGAQIDAIYTDFSNAFDRVDHIILISKLHHCGIHGSLLRWFESYLMCRTQRVMLNGFQSKPYIAHSGVPQGSHLGPILFILFINDIATCIRYSEFLVYADDLKLYKEINSFEDVRFLQADLAAVGHWCECNNMILNATKCTHIKFTKKKNIVASEYFLDNQSLSESVEVRDLGIFMDSKLSFTTHMDSIAKKSWRMLGFVKRTCKDFRNVYTILTLYNSLIRNTLEYATPVWNPHYQVHVERIESIQRAFTRFLAYKDRQCPYRADYRMRLLYFKLERLETRRQIFDLSLLYKLLHGQLDMPYTASQIGLAVPRRLPRHPAQKIFSVPVSRTNVGHFSPLNRCMRTFNDINSDEIDIFHDSYKVFRGNVREHLV